MKVCVQVAAEKDLRSGPRLAGHDPRCADRRCWIEEARVTELTGPLRVGPASGQLSTWPRMTRIFARRERPHPGAQLTLFEAEDAAKVSASHQPR